MIPVFCAEVFTEVTTATFDVTWSGGGTPFSVSWDVPAGLYWLGEMASPANPALGGAFTDVLNAADPAPGSAEWSYLVDSLSDNIGAQCYLLYILPASIPTLTATNAAGAHVLWSLGFRNATAITLSGTGGGLGTRRSATTGIPYATWWPKAYQIDETNFQVMTAMVATSRRPGSGTSVAWTRQDDRTVDRQWRLWTIQPVIAARIKRARALDPAWAVVAGLTSNPEDAALDNPDWWWSRTVDGSHRFVCIEDESEIVSGTPKYAIYQTIYDPDCPVSMDTWKGLRSPNITPVGQRNATVSSVVNFCAAVVSRGNLP